MSISSEKLQELISGCMLGNRLSQKELYKSFYSYAMAICLRYTGNREEASDVLNEAFLKVLNNLKQYDINKPFKAWLGRVVTNTAIDYYRAHIKNQVKLDDIDSAAYVSVDATVLKSLAYDELLEIIRLLPNAYRTVFNLFIIDGYTHEEIAEMLQISTGTSKSNLFKARQRMQQMLEWREQPERMLRDEPLAMIQERAAFLKKNNKNGR